MGAVGKAIMQGIWTNCNLKIVVVAGGVEGAKVLKMQPEKAPSEPFPGFGRQGLGESSRNNPWPFLTLRRNAAHLVCHRDPSEEPAR